MTVPRDRNKQKEYSRARLRDNYRELHNGTMEKETVKFLGDDVFQDSDTIDFTYTAGDSPSITAGVIDKSITDAKLRDSGPLSVVGRSANSTGSPSDISANTLYDTLWYDGTTLDFSQLPAVGVTFETNPSAPVALDIINPGAEDGDLTGWTTVRSGISAENISGRGQEGSWYFVVSGGTSSNPSAVFQDIPIPLTATSGVLAGNGVVTLQWYQSYVGTASGGFRLRTEFLDASNNDLGDGLTSNYTRGFSNPSWQQRTLTGPMPSGTTTIRLYMEGYSAWPLLDIITGSIVTTPLSSVNVQDAIDEVRQDLTGWKLGDLANVDTTGIADDYILVYDSSTSTWKPEANSGGGGSGLTQAQVLTRISLGV